MKQADVPEYTGTVMIRGRFISNPVKGGFTEWLVMLHPEDVEKILTTYDLSVYLKDMVQKEDRDLKIDIDYESGEVFINCKGFSYGISVTTDPFGVWVINELISQDNDGVYTQSGNLHKTEKTMTVLRAVASWIHDLEDSTRKC